MTEKPPSNPSEEWSAENEFEKYVIEKRVEGSKTDIEKWARSLGGMAKFQELVENELQQSGGKTELDRGKAIKRVLEKLSRGETKRIER